MNELVSLFFSPLMTKEKFASESGLTERQLKEMIKEGVIPVVKLSERRVFINVAALTINVLRDEPSTRSLIESKEGK